MLLTRFLNFIRCKKSAPPTQTLVCYQRGSITFATEVPGGPGGCIFLSDEESTKIIKEIDIKMYTGERIGDLSAVQLQNSNAYQEVLADRASAKPSTPSFT